MEENYDEVDNTEESTTETVNSVIDNPNVTSQPYSGVVYQQPKNGSRKPLKIIIAILVVLILAGAGVFIYYSLILSNPVKLTAKLLTKVGNDYNDLMEDAEIFSTGEPLKETITGSINQMSFTMNTGIDLKQNLIQFDTNLGLDGKDVIYVDGEVTPEQVVFKLAKESANSFLYKDEQIKSIFDALSQSFGNKQKIDLAKVLDYLGSSFEKNYDKKLFKKGSEEITIGTNKIKATKYTTTFTAKNLTPVLQGFVEKVSNDKELLTQLAAMMTASGQKVSPEELKQYLGLIVAILTSGISEETTDSEGIIYSIYVKGIDVVGIEIGPENDDKVYVFTYKDTIALQNNATGGGSAKEVVYNKESGDFYAKEAGKTLVSGNFKYENNKNSLDASLSLKIPQKNADMKLKIKTEKTTSLTKKSFSNPADINSAYGQYLLEKELEKNPLFAQVLESFDNTSLDLGPGYISKTKFQADNSEALELASAIDNCMLMNDKCDEKTLKEYKEHIASSGTINAVSITGNGKVESITAFSYTGQNGYTFALKSGVVCSSTTNLKKALSSIEFDNTNRNYEIASCY